ncbi:MAG TPA: hypothetical protein VJC37_00965 [Planctomycetota bacterium]|nr:hypothetical protein [Planctomycetota bacterium]
MPNILIVDQLQQTGALMKSMLNNYYGVSLSEDFPEAMKKLETALFDLVLMEVERLNADTEKFLKQAKELLPNLPVLILTEHQESLQSIQSVKMIARPFRCASLMSTIYDSLSAQDTTNTESVTFHRALTYTVEISASARATECGLKCSLTDLSHQGFMVEPAIPGPGRSAENDRTEFQNFFKTICPEGRIHSKPLYANIIIKEQEPIALNSRMAFVERGADDVFKRAGLSFLEPSKQNNRLMELLKQN